ncbi:sortilin-like [Amphiura filiformis]|uniref:sortilin-like n=1 Tax=Amphiura filiformis TaxID=82378 RepID=UPI003B21A86A
MANYSHGSMRYAQIISIFLVILGFQWQGNQVKASSGFAASFTQERVRFDKATVDKDDSTSRLVKRDVDSKCVINDIQTKLTAHSHQHQFNDSNFSLMLLWAGSDGKELLALSTLEFAFFASQSKLWVSRDFGKTFEGINHMIDDAVIKKNGGIFKSPHDPKRIILVSYTETMDRSTTKLYITKDAANSFKKITAPFYLDGPMTFHPSDESWILAHAPYQNFQLFLTKDFGITWHPIRENVVDYSWGSHKMDKNLIYVVTDDVNPANDKDPQEGEYNLLRTTTLGRTYEVIKERMYNYGIQGKFIYVAIADKKDPENRILEVSINQGQSWNATHLPVIAKDRFFSILDMNEGMVFMHVDDPGNTGAGTIYTSDSDGIIFSKSLEKHLFPKGGGVTDFYRVQSIRGVYLASQIGEDQSIHTVATYDRGGIWEDIKAPDGMKCKDSELKCNLQVNNRYSKLKGVGLPMGPLSKDSAQGLILTHAHVSDALEISDPDVFVSSDGGYAWHKALTGPHHYAITNHGGLLVAVPAGTGAATNIVKFSYDEGHCWNEFQFSEDEAGIIVTGILPEPGEKSLNISIWGFGADDHLWRAYTIDFSAILTRQCHPNDYMSWVPHLDNDNAQGCLLGLIETFEKVKPDSRCQIDPEYERPHEQNRCECSKGDYECDFGYQREDNEQECEVSPEFADKELELCINGREEEIRTKGYRKIPGDQCENGFEPTRDMETLKKKCHNDGTNLAKAGTGGHKSSSAGVVVFLIVFILGCGLCGFLFLLYRDGKLPCLRRRIASYSYSALTESDDLEKILDLDSKEHAYHDTSDEDMIE